MKKSDKQELRATLWIGAIMLSSAASYTFWGIKHHNGWVLPAGFVFGFSVSRAWKLVQEIR